eukprot:TRINITY_DN197_c0_g1_i4.p1 TRINITY_DN197_c0_g1~~TRINITY_DN197_c0_g1_i4.p1  ORF type:complete len:480 (+),score=62.85 TRINITY_DN197_c0_g1_i4:166-1605(+)
MILKALLLLLLCRWAEGLLDPCNPGDYIVDITNQVIGDIEYPVGGGNYPGSINYCFRVQTTAWVHITWERLDIEDAYHCANANPCGSIGSCDYLGGFACAYDALVAYDSANNEVRLCGTDGVLPNWQPDVAGDVVFKFTTDSSSHHTGFKLNFRICNDPPYGIQREVEPEYCHRAYVAEYSGSSGNIVYPSSGDYPPGDRKCWRIHCNGQIELSWNVLSTEPDSGCIWDRVSIFDSDGKEHMMCKLNAANNYPDSFEYPPGDLVLYFHSDLCSHDIGFDVDWTCNPWSYPSAPAVATLWTHKCGTLDYDLVPNVNPTSIVFPSSGSYSSTASLCVRFQCSGLIRITNWAHLDLESSTHCTDDYIRFHQTNGIWSPLICGSTNPTWTPTEIGDVTLMFVADGDFSTGTGFQFTYTCDTSVVYTPPPAPPTPLSHLDTPVPPSTQCDVTAVPTAVPTDAVACTQDTTAPCPAGTIPALLVT